METLKTIFTTQKNAAELGLQIAELMKTNARLEEELKQERQRNLKLEKEQVDYLVRNTR